MQNFLSYTLIWQSYFPVDSTANLNLSNQGVKFLGDWTKSSMLYKMKYRVLKIVFQL